MARSDYAQICSSYNQNIIFHKKQKIETSHKLSFFVLFSSFNLFDFLDYASLNTFNFVFRLY